MSKILWVGPSEGKGCSQFLCSSLRCEGDSAVLQPCNATSNTICAINPQSGKGLIPSLKFIKAKD